MNAPATQSDRARLCEYEAGPVPTKLGRSLALQRKIAHGRLLMVLLLAFYLPTGYGVLFADTPDEKELVSAIDHALQYLRQEAASCHRENRCFSCHNNGDAIRALCMGKRYGYHVDLRQLRDTIDWLRAPTNWKNSPGDARFQDKRLAALQLSFALLALADSREIVAHDDELSVAANLVAEHQHADGS